jgi:hypothetical protein
MNDDFRKMRRQIGQGVATTLLFAGLFLLLSVGAALLGLPHPVESFKSAAKACGYAAAVMASIYALAYLFSATVQTVRWLRV